jgi:glycoside/pentoside/hexuronide:cation symporter, GPH family
MNEQLSVKTKLAFGAGDLGAAIVAGVSGFFLQTFFLDVALLPASMISVVFFVATIWDAINDPLTGSLSDRTKSRFGRRRPWLLFAAVPFGVMYMFQWLVPSDDPNTLLLYYIVVAILLNTFFTAVNVPYTALTAELTSDYAERTRLTAFRFGFSILGAVGAVGLHPVIVGLFGDVRTGYMIAGFVWGVMIVASAWITFFFVREKPQPDIEVEKPLGMYAGIRIAFANRPFLYVTLIYLLSWLTIQFVQNNLLLYVTYWVNARDSFTLMVLILQATAFGFLPIWSRVSARFGKQYTYIVGVVIWMVALLVVFFIPPQTALPLYFVVFFAGIGVSVAYLIPWSMLPDVIEYDELQTGQRREGVYYGFFVFLQKLGLAIGLALSNLVLSSAGYINPETAGAIVTQPDSVLLVLRLFVSFVPVVLLLLSLPLAYYFPITREKFAEIQAQLQQKKQQ